MPAPSIDTVRLHMRGHRLEDHEEYSAMWGDPRVTRHIGGRPFSAEECWQRLMRNVGHWELLGFGYWMLHDADSGRLVGEVGFADLRRDLEPSLGDDPEMGWVLAPWAHGRGLATEAVTACLAWAAGRWGARRMVCIIDPENTPSLRVAEKANFRELVRTTYHGSPTVVMERPAR